MYGVRLIQLSAKARLGLGAIRELDAFYLGSTDPVHGLLGGLKYTPQTNSGVEIAADDAPLCVQKLIKGKPPVTKLNPCNRCIYGLVDHMESIFFLGKPEFTSMLACLLLVGPANYP